MNLGIETKVIADDAPQVLQTAALVVGPRRVHQRMANAGVKLTSQHLRQLNADRANQIGGKRSNFYGKFAKPGNLKTEATDERAAVVIGPADFGEKNALWKHYVGGVIEAKPGKALAVPVNAAAYGIAPRTFTNLRLIILGKEKRIAVLAAVGGEGAKAKGQTTRKERKAGSANSLDKLEVMYLLLKRVTLKPDRSVLPSPMEYAWAAEAALRQMASELNHFKPGGALS